MTYLQKQGLDAIKALEGLKAKEAI